MAAPKMHLTYDLITQLIKEVRKRSFLWNPEDNNYNDRNLLAIAWKEIEQNMNIPETVLRSKWRNLRDLFKREVKKTNISSLKLYKGKWRLFSHLWFLHKPETAIQVCDYREGTPTEDIGNFKFLHEEEDFKESIENDDDQQNTFVMETQYIRDDKRPYSEDDLNSDMRPKIEEDYDMMFLKSLKPYFDALNPIRKLVVRNKIQELLLKELMTPVQ